MAVRDGLLISRNFSSSPGTSMVIDIPEGYTIAVVTVVNVGISTSDYILIRLSSSGTPLALDARQFIGDQFTSSVSDLSAGLALSAGISASAHYAVAQIWNLNTLAPVTMFQEYMRTPYNHRAGVYKSVVAHNQLYISSNSGYTLNAGSIYVQLYKRPNVVVAQDFTADPLANWDLGGLEANTDSAIVVTAYDLTMSASAGINAQVSADGTTFQDGGTDYTFAFVVDNGDDASANSFLAMSAKGGTFQGLCGIITGLPVECQTLVRSNDFLIGVSNRGLHMSSREARVVEKSLRIFPTGGATTNGGTAYAVKYAL